jgi:predicted metal-binding protein
MRKILDSYSCALLIRFKGHERVNEVIVALEKEMLKDGYYKAFAFGAGPCLLCEACNVQVCSFPSDARPSLSGCGVDVFATVNANGFAMTLDMEDPSETDCFGLILME